MGTKEANTLDTSFKSGNPPNGVSRKIIVAFNAVDSLLPNTTDIKAECEEFKRECLKLYVNGMGFRAIERVKGVHNTTIMAWVKEVGELLIAYDAETIPQVGELDELETFVGQKKTKSGSGRR